MTPKHPDEAAQTEEACRGQFATVPDQPDAASLHGLVLMEQGRLAEAAAALRRAIELRPAFPEACYNLGNALRAQGKLDEAADSYRRAIALRPELAEAHNNLGSTLQDLAQPEAAAGCYRRALAIRPAYAEAHYNLGNALQDLGRPEAAIESFRQALALRPDVPDIHNNLGKAYQDLGRLEAAMASFQGALAVQAEDAKAHWNIALLQLLRGDFARGFVGYEWRWPLRISRPRDFAQPAWDGAPFPGRRLLLHAEQGFGDSIQFIRYLPQVAALGGEVVVECPTALVRLFKALPGIAEVVANGAILPAFDLHAPLMSLGRLLGTTLATIPAAV
ncbi:MAG TPA: tetratricopeptide repeat protein, partial [Dongiaceae bacterium]|nr:tetratricopeptide repeat protein [Dongiaceae bacterium]